MLELMAAANIYTINAKLQAEEFCEMGRNVA